MLYLLVYRKFKKKNEDKQDDNTVVIEYSDNKSENKSDNKSENKSEINPENKLEDKPEINTKRYSLKNN